MLVYLNWKMKCTLFINGLSTKVKRQRLSDSIFLFFCLFTFSRAAPMSYGGFQARGLIGCCSCRPMPQPQQRGMWATSGTYTTAHGNAGSLTHWARPGVEPTTSVFLVKFINHWATMATPDSIFLRQAPTICSLKETSFTYKGTD